MSPESHELIVVPEYIQKSLALEAERIAEARRLAEAANNVIDGAPGILRPSPEGVSEPVSVKPGKFGRGVVETVMPADASHVIGWDGIVRR